MVYLYKFVENQPTIQEPDSRAHKYRRAEANALLNGIRAESNISPQPL